MKTTSYSCVLFFAVLPFFALAPLARGASKGAGDYLVYVGTYTKNHNGSKGIYVYRFSTATGKLTPMGLAGESANPSFVAIDASGRYLYAVNELSSFDGKKGGAVSAFAINRRTGKLKFLNQVASHGMAPCFVAVDKTGHYVMVANYSSGTVAVFKVNKNGSLGETTADVQQTGSSVDPKRQTRPYAHMINVSPDNRFALSCDLGTDQVLVYHFDAKNGTLTADDPPYSKVNPGSGPRHFVFSPNGRYVYVISEMGSNVTVFSYKPSTGGLHKLQTLSALPADFKGKESDSAEIAVLPNGKFVYGSNRGHDSIAVFKVAPGKGMLTPIQWAPVEGKEPRNFTIDPTGHWLIAANQDSNNITVFRINDKNGKLTYTGESIDLPAPVCIQFLKVR